MKLVLLVFSIINFGILCYGRYEPRIWNGVSVGPEKYPNVIRSIGVYLNMNESYPPMVMHNMCTGTVISPRHILTAGHCVNFYVVIDDVKKIADTYPITAFMIDFGEVDTNFPALINLKTHGFSTVAKQKGWIAMNDRKDDIAIIEFPEGYDLKITPVILAKNFVEDGSDIGTNVGYGKTGPMLDPKTSFNPPSLMEINVTIWKDCQPNTPEHHVMCIGNKTHHADAGDSGGPLFLTRGDQMFQIGITQSVSNINGTSPGDAAEINLITRVSDYCDWIEETTKVKCVEMPPRSSPTPESPTPAPNDENGSDAMLKNIFIILFASILNIALLS